MPKLQTKPSHEPALKDRLWVKVCTAGGIEQAHIAAVIGINRSTLRKHYKSELAHGAPEVNGIVIAALFNQCKKGDVKALIHWTQCRMGWRETKTIENVGKDGRPMEHVYRWAEPVKE